LTTGSDLSGGMTAPLTGDMPARPGSRDAGFSLGLELIGRLRALLPDQAFDAILEVLYRHVETPEFCMRFKWQRNSIAFWDNRRVQHHALWDYYPNKRYGHRVTICGEKPYRRASCLRAGVFLGTPTSLRVS